MSLTLKNLGININTLPVLDVLRNNTNKVIGNRSFSKDPLEAKLLGQICVRQYKLNKLGTVIKHIPGHGHSNADSHHKLPIINKSIKYLNNHDFKAFKNKKSLFSMTAHIIYSQIDPINSATHSKKMIRLIRDKLLFKNLIMSDDISMKALKFNIIKNTQKF